MTPSTPPSSVDPMEVPLMSDEQMVPLLVPESVVREFADGACYSAADYRRFADTASWPRRLDYLARAAAIEWAEANPEREWVTRDTPLGTSIRHKDGPVASVLAGWDEGYPVLRVGTDDIPYYLRGAPADGWFVVKGAADE